MVDWNPSHHTRHAWADAKTIWGKLGLVVFYSLIWLSIIAAAVTVVWPARSQGADCFITTVAGGNETVRMTLETMVRSMNILWIGFMAYADVGGLKIKNTAMVAVFVIAAALSDIPVATIAIDAGCMAAHWQLWVYPVWAVLALILTVLEYKFGDHGSAEENQNLV